MTNHEQKIARVIIVNPDKEDATIILNRRPDWSKQAAGKLQIMGGKIEAEDKSREHAAQREILEELGLEIKINQLLFICATENNGWETFAFMLILDEEYDANQMPNHGEFDKIEFIKIENILTLIEQGEIAFDHPAILQEFLELVEAGI